MNYKETIDEIAKMLKHLSGADDWEYWLLVQAMMLYLDDDLDGSFKLSCLQLIQSIITNENFSMWFFSDFIFEEQEKLLSDD